MSHIIQIVRSIVQVIQIVRNMYNLYTYCYGHWPGLLVKDRAVSYILSWTEHYPGHTDCQKQCQGQDINFIWSDIQDSTVSSDVGVSFCCIGGSWLLCLRQISFTFYLFCQIPCAFWHVSHLLCYILSPDYQGQYPGHKDVVFFICQKVKYS